LRIIGAGTALRPPSRSWFTGFSQANAEEMRVLVYPDIHTGRALDRQTAAYHEIPLSSAARDPTLPRAARIRHQAESLVSVVWGLIPLL
jgi:hypothetical protein